MNFVDIFGVERISYLNSLSLKKVFEKNSDKLFTDNEYVVVWYRKISNDNNNDKKLVEILFVNISTKKPSNFQISINVSINYLHKIRIGSIWINGRSKEYFKNEIFDISIKNENYNINSFRRMTLDKKTNDYPFLESEYPIRELYYDKNKLIKILWNNKSIIIHPLTFFITHYGYSTEIKRVLLTYLWGYSGTNEDTVRSLLNLSDHHYNSTDSIVVLPNKCTVRDAVFLYHLKHDPYTQEKVKHIVNGARQALVKSDSGYDFYPTISPWHTQQIDLRISGIHLNDSTILCTGITAISEPTGSDITLLMPPVYKKKIEDINVEENSQEIAIRLRRKQELEKVEVDDAKKINNLHIATIKEKLGILGNTRTINKNYEIKESGVTKKFKLINSDEPKDYSVGAGEGGNGQTGLADCFYETNNVSDHIKPFNNERLEKLWEHALDLKKRYSAIVHWFTFKKGFVDSPLFRTMSMTNCHIDNSTDYPKEVLILKVIMKNNEYIVIDFATEKNRSEQKQKATRGIVIKLEESIESFLNIQNNSGLSSILIHIAIMNGVISYGYLDSFKGKMALFNHRDGQKNNWILNGIEKII